jgi:hypothetical protein
MFHTMADRHRRNVVHGYRDDPQTHATVVSATTALLTGRDEAYPTLVFTNIPICIPEGVPVLCSRLIQWVFYDRLE